MNFLVTMKHAAALITVQILAALADVLGLVSSTHIGLAAIGSSNSKRSGTSSLNSVYVVKNQSCWRQALE